MKLRTGLDWKKLGQFFSFRKRIIIKYRFKKTCLFFFVVVVVSFSFDDEFSRFIQISFFTN